MKNEYKKQIKLGIFVDDANIFYAQKKAGWRIDIKKLKKLLTHEANISFVRYYIAVPAKWDHAYKATKQYLTRLNKSVAIKTKPLKYIKSGNQIVKKGNVDLELSLDVVRFLEDLDGVIIVSGDSDYVELRRYVLEQGKKIVFFGFKASMAWEIKKGKYVFLDKLRPWIELGKKTPRYYPGRLLLSNLYQKKKKLSRGI